MIPRNRKSIRKRAAYFWGLFVILLAFTVLPACCFIWTAGMQNDERENAWKEYKKLQDRGTELYGRTGSALIAIKNITKYNYSTQAEKIRSLKDITDKLIGKDSTKLFLGYNHISTYATELMNCTNERVRAEEKLRILENNQHQLDSEIYNNR